MGGRSGRGVGATVGGGYGSGVGVGGRVGIIGIVVPNGYIVPPVRVKWIVTESEGSGPGVGVVALATIWKRPSLCGNRNVRVKRRGRFAFAPTSQLAPLFQTAPSFV